MADLDYPRVLASFLRAIQIKKKTLARGGVDKICVSISKSPRAHTEVLRASGLTDCTLGAVICSVQLYLGAEFR